MNLVLDRVKGLFAPLFPLHTNGKVKALLDDLNASRTKEWMIGLYNDSLRHRAARAEGSVANLLSVNRRLRKELDDCWDELRMERERLSSAHRRLESFETHSSSGVEAPYTPSVDAYVRRAAPWEAVNISLTMPAFRAGVHISSVSAADVRAYDIYASALARKLSIQAAAAFYNKAIEEFEKIRPRLIRTKE